MADLSRAELEFIKNLREASQDVKDCFTKFSFQALAISAGGLGIILKLQFSDPIFGFANILIFMLALSVARIGIYKYTTANRQAGYELHLYRTLALPDSEGDGWNASMRKIGWEEAMRAWRVVQTTAFEHLYETGTWKPNTIKKKHNNQNYKWFEIRSLIKKGSVYYAGSYLETMIGLLYMVSIISVSFIIMMSIQLYIKTGLSAAFYLSTIISFSSVMVVFLQVKFGVSRRRLLEDGFHSIHSCAIMWQGVTVAHFRAMNQLKNKHGDGHLNGYTEALSEQAIELKKNIFGIHEWVK